MAGKPSFSFINDGRWHYQGQQVKEYTIAIIKLKIDKKKVQK